MAIKVEGLPELMRACAEIQREFPEAFREAAIDVASQVVNDARSAAHSRQQQLAAASLYAGSDDQAGTIISDWAGFPGSEFGGGMRPETKQFPPYNGQRGYFLYPSMRQNAGNLDVIWEAALQKSMEKWKHSEPR